MHITAREEQARPVRCSTRPPPSTPPARCLPCSPPPAPPCTPHLHEHVDLAVLVLRPPLDGVVAGLAHEVIQLLQLLLWKVGVGGWKVRGWGREGGREVGGR